MSQALILKNKGIHTSPNEFSSVPEGAMTVADNCVVDDENVLAPRRGFSRYIAFGSVGNRARRYTDFEGTMIAAYSTSTIARYNSGSWADYSGTYTDPDANLARLQFLKVQSNLYFNTSGGVYRLDSPTGTPALSGICKALDIQLALGSAGSALEADNQVAYRMIWGIRDANNNIVVGAPSGRATITNPSTGSTKDVTITFTIPSDVTTSYFFQVYRSTQSGGDTIEPSDDLQLVYENQPTSGEISAKVVTFTDSVPPTLLGASLYTNPNQETIIQANERPPKADYISFWQDCTFFAKCVGKQRRTLTILSAASISYNDTITIAGTVYTARGTEASASGQYSLAKVFTTTADTTIGNPTLTNVASTIGLKVGRKISGTNIPADTYIGSIGATTIGLVQSDGVTAQNATGTTAGVTITVTPNTVAYGSTTSTPAQNIADTAESLIRVINRYASNTSVYAYLLSGYQDLPGQIVIEERGVGASSFAIVASAAGTSFNPVLPTSGTTVSSTNDDFQHQLFFSKKDKPEAVPLLNYKFIGSANNKILAIIPLRTALYILKDKEGIYRLTGTDPSNFQVDLFDSSANLISPDSVAVVNNQIWCLTDQGVTTITDTGVSVASRPIEDIIFNIIGSARTACQYYSFGVGYETDRKYILWTVSGSADTYATQAYVFNTFTRAFTRWDIPATTAFVNPSDNKLYIGRGDNFYTLQERKAIDYSDYADHTVSVTIVSSSGTSIVLSTNVGVTAGDVIFQNSAFSLVTDVSADGITITVNDSLSTWTAGAATVYVAYESKAEYAAVTGGNPGMTKQFSEISYLFKSARFVNGQFGFATDVNGSFEYVDIEGSSSGNWGLFVWGSSPWGGVGVSVPIRTFVPLERQRGTLLRNQFKIRNAYSPWKLNGISVVFTEDDTFTAK